MLKLLQSVTQSALQGCTVLGQSCSSNIIFGTMKFSCGETTAFATMQPQSPPSGYGGSGRLNINNGNYVTGELLCSFSASKQCRQSNTPARRRRLGVEALASSMQTLQGLHVHASASLLKRGLTAANKASTAHVMDAALLATMQCRVVSTRRRFLD